MPIPSCKDLLPIIRHSGYTQSYDETKTNLASTRASVTCDACKRLSKNYIFHLIRLSSKWIMAI